MAHYIARWTQITVTLLIIGPAALAQTDYPLPGQPPIAQPTTTQPVTWRRAAGLSVDCGQDLQQFCYGVQPGEGRLIRCLSSHQSQLSPSCISRLAAARPAPGVAPPSENTQSSGLPSANPPAAHAVTETALRASCGPDVKKLCNGIFRDNGSVIKCLSAHRMQLSLTCDLFFKEMPVGRTAQKSAPKTTTAKSPAAIPAAANGAVGAPPAANGPTAAPAAANGATDPGPSALTAQPTKSAPPAASSPPARGALAFPL